MKKDNFKVSFLVVGDNAITEYKYGNYKVLVSQNKLMLDARFSIQVFHNGDLVLCDEVVSNCYIGGILRHLFYGCVNVESVATRVQWIRKIKKQRNKVIL